MERYYEIPEGDGLIRQIRNPLEEAIHDVLGGPVPAADLLGMSRQGVHYLLGTKRLRDRDVAVKLAEATMVKGRPVPATELLDLEPWRGPERNGAGSQRRKRRNGKPTGSSAARSQVELDRSVTPEQLSKVA